MANSNPSADSSLSGAASPPALEQARAEVYAALRGFDTVGDHGGSPHEVAENRFDIAINRLIAAVRQSPPVLKDMPPEFAKVLDEHFDELLSRKSPPVPVEDNENDSGATPRRSPVHVPEAVPQLSHAIREGSRVASTNHVAARTGAQIALRVAQERLKVTEAYWAQKNADNPDSFTVLGSYAQARQAVGTIDALLAEVGCAPDSSQRSSVETPERQRKDPNPQIAPVRRDAQEKDHDAV